MKDKKIKYEIVEIEWFDAQSGFGIAGNIEELVEYTKPIHSHSSGYLLFECKEYLILGFFLFGEDSVKHWQMIPTGMIKKITRL